MNKVYGHIVVQDQIADVLRALESMQYCCDEILLVDGGSIDGTRELLEDRKQFYKLTIFDRKFDTVKNQRQFLLDQTPRNHWVIVLDPDEKFSQIFQYGIKKYLETVDPKLLENRELPLVIPINHLNLINDLFHYAGVGVPHNMRVFWNDPKVMWGGPDYHCYLVHEDKQEEHYIDMLQPVKGFGIQHYARLDPARIRARQARLNDEKMGGYDKDSWKDEATVNILPAEYF